MTLLFIQHSTFKIQHNVFPEFLIFISENDEMKYITILLSVLFATQAEAQNYSAMIEAKTQQLLPKVIEWRRYLHQHPELSNREVKTAEYVAKHLQSLGYEVQAGIAKTGVVAILKGGKPGPVIALRADMDALPVAEEQMFHSRLKLPVITWAKLSGDACLWT